jgi:hypothetical protein
MAKQVIDLVRVATSITEKVLRPKHDSRSEQPMPLVGKVTRPQPNGK